MQLYTSKTTAYLALALGLAAGATQAQQTNVFDTADTATEAADATADAAREDLARSRDADRFGAAYRKLGWYGAVSATANATAGNSDTFDAGIGAKFGHFDGTNGHDFVLSYTYSAEDGASSANSLLAAYDYSHSFTDRAYGFANVRANYDEFGSYEEDYFAGFGVGYRLVNTDDFTWRVQAGPGWRWTTDANGTRREEAAAQLGSRLYYNVNDDIFLTNDTDILSSESDTLISNELGMNVSLSGPLALRASLRSDYHTDPLPGHKDTDHTAGLSLVYSFR